MYQKSSEQHEGALKLICEEYETAARMRDFAQRVGVDHLNRVRPPSLRYHSVDEVFREFLYAPNAVANFAGRLGLISSEDALQIILDFHKAHPELPRDEDFEIPSD